MFSFLFLGRTSFLSDQSLAHPYILTELLPLHPKEKKMKKKKRVIHQATGLPGSKGLSVFLPVSVASSDGPQVSLELGILSPGGTLSPGRRSRHSSLFTLWFLNDNGL